MSSGSFYDKRNADEVDWIEQPNLPIGVYCGVFGKEEHEAEQGSGSSLKQENQYIPKPEVSPQPCFEKQDEEAKRSKAKHDLQGRKWELALHDLFFCLKQHFLASYERPHFPLAITDKGAIEGLHHVLGNEHRRPFRHDCIDFGTKQKVVAFLCPRMLSRVMMQNFSSRQMRQGVGILYSSHDDLLHHIAHLCRAVAVKEAVTIDAILRLTVLDEIAHQPTCLIWREVQFLFGNA